ncbi:MAG: sigma-70 family RNA polymerase sigma factor [Bernardetiaceae bacterium]|nr:sigma-70 family RNA polymerase sigma factor [Bernardetiaceae bacterium]
MIEHTIKQKLYRNIPEADTLISDIQQEVYLILWEEITSNRFENVKNQAAWIKTITQRRTIDYCKRENRKMTMHGEFYNELENTVQTHYQADIQEFERILMGTLTAQQQKICVFLARNEKQKDIADYCETTTNNVKTQIQNIRTKIATTLKKEYPSLANDYLKKIQKYLK